MWITFHEFEAKSISLQLKAGRKTEKKSKVQPQNEAKMALFEGKQLV